MKLIKWTFDPDIVCLYIIQGVVLMSMNMREKASFYWYELSFCLQTFLHRIMII